MLFFSMDHHGIPNLKILSFMASLSIVVGEIRGAEGYLLELLSLCILRHQLGKPSIPKELS